MQGDVSKHPVQSHIGPVTGVNQNGAERKAVAGQHTELDPIVIMQKKERMR